VRAERGGTIADAALSPETATAETTPRRPAPSPPPTAAGSDPTAAAPPPTVDDLSYFKRLEKPNPPAENLKAAPAPEKRIATTADASTATAPRTPAPALIATTKDVLGYVVQVAALNVRGEADAIVDRLTSKGYAAFVLAPATGTPAVYRVRVGKFGTRREAETIAAKLQREEQFKPWITR
jgi:cell division protein FtsN